MKVLVVGATGNLGSRIVAALLTRGHDVAAYVRSKEKLESLLPADLLREITIVQGDAKDSIAIKHAILDTRSDAIVNTAGLAAFAPWAKSDLPEIFQAVLKAARDAGNERNAPLRAWFLAGMGVLNYPGSDTMLSNYIPIILEHRTNLKLLQSLPPNSVDWSLLCPSAMNPESPNMTFPLSSSKGNLVATASIPPQWRKSWLAHIPVIGPILDIAVNVSRYTTTLEQNADLIATDLETRDSRWNRQIVGVIDPSL